MLELMEFTLTTMYFRFRSQPYRQQFRDAMGSPVSPLVADSYMEHLQQTAIATAPSDMKPRLWKCYVDYILEVIKKDTVSDFTDHLNQVDETRSIKFTFKSENDNALPFFGRPYYRSSL